MGQARLLAASIAALIVACIAGAVSDTQARVAAPVDPFELMTRGKQLPTLQFVDYTFVFH
jgi:hypothetical protein